MVNVKFQKGYENLIRRLDLICTKMELSKAVYRAAQRAAQSGVTIVKREISDETTLKQSTIAKAVKKYVHGNPIAEYSIGVRISDTARPLSEFNFTPKTPKPRTAPTVEIYRGVKKKFEKGAFVQRMPSGHIGVFERVGKNRLPIRELRGPAITGIFKENEGLQDRVFDRIYEILEKRINHELHYILDNK